MTKNKYVAKQVDYITRAITELSDYWIETFEGEPCILDNGYPSDWPSFTELAQDFRNWNSFVEEKYEEYNQSFEFWKKDKSIEEVKGMGKPWDYFYNVPDVRYCWTYENSAYIGIKDNGQYVLCTESGEYIEKELEYLEDMLFNHLWHQGYRIPCDVIKKNK